MNFKKVWIITKSLLLSQLRATATSRRMGSIRSLIRRPRILLILDIAAFVIVSSLAYYFSSSLFGGSAKSGFSMYVSSAIVIMPALLIAMVLLFGLIFEITSSYQFSSSDTVNWLPVTAQEYVLASILSLLIYYSVVPVIVIAGIFSLAYVFGMLPAWELATVLSIFGVFLSASVLEIIRAVLNRFSSSFYKRGGQAAIAARAIFGVLILVSFQILFYPTFYTRFIGAISSSFGPTWFIPILWGSVSVAAFLASSLQTWVLFGAMSIVLAGVLFYIAISARSRYWVPIPASIRISTSVYAPKSKPSVLRFMSTAELAIARKDIRGLFRRKEMVRLLALPAIFLVTSVFGFSSGGGASSSGEFVVYFGVFVAGISAFFIASSSVGSEGKSIMTLYQAPVGVKDFLIGKLTLPSLFGSIFGIIFFSVIAVVFHFAGPLTVPIFLVLSILLSVELSLVGLYIGARFPNFSEAPRASYMSQTAALIAFPVAAILTGIPIAPLFVTFILGMGLGDVLIAFIAGLILIAFISFLFYRLSTGRVKKLLSEIPF